MAVTALGCWALVDRGLERERLWWARHQPKGHTPSASRPLSEMTGVFGVNGSGSRPISGVTGLSGSRPLSEATALEAASSPSDSRPLSSLTEGASVTGAMKGSEFDMSRVQPSIIVDRPDSVGAQEMMELEAQHADAERFTHPQLVTRRTDSNRAVNQA